ncbi:metal/formaldehyde-sensitive transcriptional repressor [Brucella intermedia]|jgi:DNA-binding FrmR family transcriptional regulator|uniref:DNA-binding FrmR family transcriptional regulator n=2 Tax=Brucella intermedia TaxID=94625 RepID=A0ABR6AQT8_9HYPH|nr:MULTISPECIES: metal/formaldehyde-sensitive transcriptional repressor [Brucella/Ochrobactrum group]ERI15008.1 regulator [Ochrobactrum sp. EGD-AQ16]KAB2672778.1 metal/formaldehyde-sensitive transcriptional repressor [Ochrobactrum sp. LMG 5442]KAB2695917.1 metal/formaldehyde-sensitive transcriptional repressor [Brucella intermedia]KAB2713443.1 metal/formaldehyde-sensitive transcriptional repressor [Brucella intermedia]KAB2720074.1 metal/formaldehyde-sensitive transcriptional repressor [Brucell
MPHSPEDKKRALTRLRRIRGQAEALERAVEAGTECAALLQQIAALRGAANGLMAEVLESHFRETFGHEASADPDTQIDEIMRILRTYLK